MVLKARHTTLRASVMPSPPDPVAFSVFGLDVRWYALFMLAGIIAGMCSLVPLPAGSGFDPDWVIDAAPWVVLFSIVGARAYYVVLRAEHFVSHPVEAINIRLGGFRSMARSSRARSHLQFFAAATRQPFLWWTDAVVPAVALAQAIGRWGNWANQEAFGTPTTAPWGLWIDPDRRPAEFADIRTVSPNVPLRVAVQPGERGSALLGRAPHTGVRAVSPRGRAGHLSDQLRRREIPDRADSHG